MVHTPIVGTLQLSGCNYQFGWDLISQNTANNTSTVSFYGILNVTNNYVSWSSGTASVHTASAGLSTRYNKGSYVVVQSNFTFTHNNDGNLTLTLGYSFNTTYTSGSGTVVITLPQIKRFAQITSTPSSLNDEGEPYITFTNPGNATNLNAWLEVNPTGTHYATRNIDISSGTYTWELTNEEREQLRSVIPNSNTGTIRLGLYSTQSGTTGATYKDIPFSIINANPTQATFTLTEENTKITSNNLLTNPAYDVIEGYSNKKATITTANKGEAIKGASIVKYRFISEDKTGEISVDIPYSATEDVEGTLYGLTNLEYILETIDSRGNTSSDGGLIIGPRLVNYSPISFNKDSCILERDDGQVGENATLTLDGYIWNGNFGNKANEIRSLTYRLKKTDSDTWIIGTTTITPTLNENSFTYSGAIASDNSDGKWDLDSSYNVEITIEDYLETSTISFILNSAKPTLSLDKNGVGVLCAYDNNKGGVLQVDGKVIDGGTLLWTNSSPTSNFAAQTITLNENLSGYDFYEILFRQGTTTARIMTTGKIPVGYGTILQWNTSNNFWRPTDEVVSGTTITFEANRMGNNEDNSFTIPMYVIGYKTNILN